MKYEGSMLSRTGRLYWNRPVPPARIPVTWLMKNATDWPIPGGTVHVTLTLSVTTTRFVHSLPPIVMLAMVDASPRSVPMIVSVYPPSTSPVSGEMEDSFGAPWNSNNGACTCWLTIVAEIEVDRYGPAGSPMQANADEFSNATDPHDFPPKVIAEGSIPAITLPRFEPRTVKLPPLMVATDGLICNIDGVLKLKREFALLLLPPRVVILTIRDLPPPPVISHSTMRFELSVAWADMAMGEHGNQVFVTDSPILILEMSDAEFPTFVASILTVVVASVGALFPEVMEAYGVPNMVSCPLGSTAVSPARVTLVSPSAKLPATNPLHWSAVALTRVTEEHDYP